MIDIYLCFGSESKLRSTPNAFTDGKSSLLSKPSCAIVIEAIRKFSIKFSSIKLQTYENDNHDVSQVVVKQFFLAVLYSLDHLH